METRTARHVPGLVIVLAAAVGLGAITWGLNRGNRPDTGLSPAPNAPAPPAAPSPQTVAASAAASPEAAAPEGADAPEAAPAAEGAPTFDVVRVAPDGSALVAGTAEPGAAVTIFADAAPLASAVADSDGNFAAMFRAEPSTVPQALTLGAGDLRSTETVMLLPETTIAPSAGETASAAPEPTAEPAAETAPRVAAAVVVGSDSVEVQPTAAAGDRVSLGSISYAEQGEVTLAGAGTAGSTLRAYVDDQLAEVTSVGDDGRWQLALNDVAAGLYRLRIDEIGPDGRVTSRVETPFQRDFPRMPRPRPGSELVPSDDTITVQPGNNLWTIARERYGSGILYAQIFTANRDLIRDPELIYPGQIFTMPEAIGAAPGPDVTGPRPRGE